MGGKKKRRAEAAAVAAAARFQRPQAAPPANSEKSQSPRPPVAKPTAKENKVKTGPKMYSFGASGASDLGTAGTSDRTVLKVVIKSELEKKVIGLINQFKVHHSKSGTISGRLTAKKLQDIYSALQDFSFRTEDIEEAMKNTVVYGGDLHSALDWLCLNLPDDLLPDGFSQKLEEEETKSKPKFQMPVICATNHEVCDRKKNVKKPEAKVAESESSQVSMKDWILQYAEASSGSDADEIDRDIKEPENSEMEERFDPAPATKRPMTSREKMRRLRAKKRQLDPDFSSKESKRVEALRTKRLQKMTKDQMTAYRQAAAARKQKSRLNKLKTELSEAQVPFFGK